jgi:type I thyroxine 5'-deiodinase
MSEIHRQYCVETIDCKPYAKFLTIYIAEAHARDEWWIPHAPNAHEGGAACILQHRSIDSRINAAKSFADDFQVDFEVVCDSMKNEVCELYDSYPERLYIIERGVVVYQGGHGPFDFKLEEVDAWLKQKVERLV